MTTDDARATTQANAVTAVWGITGTGKTSLIGTAVKYCWEKYHHITRIVSSDLGGWGNQLLSLIDLGLAQVWYIRNHVRPFETMELASLGFWPEEILDLHKGMADPNVALIAPYQARYTLICPQGHPVATFDDEATLQAAQLACPTCGTITTIVTCLRIDKAIIRSKGTSRVGLRCFDSMTQMNEWALSDLQFKSGKGELPIGQKGGSALGSADALREGRFTFGTSSEAQYGFVQTRTGGWIANIRSIPDQLVPPIMTFGVEQTKDKASYGPKIAGNAMTLTIPGWLGNCLHATTDAVGLTEDGVSIMRHRLWLVNHFNPTDPTRAIYVAKHRGEPLGMPDYLEDDIGPDGRSIPWSRFSLKVLFELLDAQLITIRARDAQQYPDAPALQPEVEEKDEVISTVAQVAPVTAAGPVPVTGRVIKRGRARRAGTAMEAPADPATMQALVEQTVAAVAAVPPPTPTAPVAVGLALTDSQGQWIGPPAALAPPATQEPPPAAPAPASVASAAAPEGQATPPPAGPQRVSGHIIRRTRPPVQ